MEGLRKEIKLSGMIAMAAGGMIAAWMVEIKYWFEIGGAGAALSLLTCAVLILPLAFILSRLFQAAGVWHAFWITEFVSAVISGIICKKEIFQ